MPEDVEATKLIPDLETSLVEKVAQNLRVKIDSGKKPDGYYHGSPYYSFGDKGEGYITLQNADGKVVYLVRHRIVRHNRLHFGRQVLVWSDRKDPTSPRFAQTIFFNVLLPKYKALIADQEQTKAGQRFWMYALMKAFDDNLYVYILDRRSSPNRLLELSSYAQVLSNKDILWGTTRGHLRTFAVISKVPLKLK